MSRAEFDEVMPHEFWREVVDRVAEEAPDTLLLAEAFWLLEGYFVRTLGMHRVYNSAFMNMLRDERNSEYRQLIRSTLEFDPQILKRYVNFMSNPDERTAVDQFGTGDKYFGVATLMATMPGLPMFGHGQIEGLAEKYGMEFRRPRWDEAPDEGLVARHEPQLFPLLRRRRIFAEVDRFLLYDFVTDDGSVDENVFAYSNEVDGERSLVIFNNRYGDTRGRIHTSTGVISCRRKLRRAARAHFPRRWSSLAGGENTYLIARDVVTGLEHLWPCSRLRNGGMELELGAYRLHCFLDFREVVSDEDHPWAELADELGGRGTRCVDEALGVRAMAPVLGPLRRLMDASVLRGLADPEEAETAATRLRDTAVTEVAELVAAAAKVAGYDGPTSAIEGAILNDLEAVLALSEHVGKRPARVDEEVDSPKELLLEAAASPQRLAAVLVWIVARHLNRMDGRDRESAAEGTLLDRWHLGAVLAEVEGLLGLTDDAARWAVRAVELLSAAPKWNEDAPVLAGDFLEAFADPLGCWLLGVNTYRGERFFNRERFQDLAYLILLTGAVRTVTEDPLSAPEGLSRRRDAVQSLLVEAEASGYRVEEFLAGFEEATDRSDPEE